MRWDVAAGVLTGLAAGWYLWTQSQHAEDNVVTKQGRKKQWDKHGSNAYHRLMTEEEYTKLIPPTELKQVKAILSTIYKARGWGVSKHRCIAAWQEVVATAMTEQSGAWTTQVPIQDLTANRLALLAAVIDSTLLGGQLQAWLQQQPGKQPVAFQPISWSIGPDDWFANFFPSKNTVALKRTKWTEAALQVTPARPANYEGIHCTTRLEVLVHILAHELIHALVYHRLPHIDARSPAYLADERHGPIFRLLSNKLLGHTTEDFKSAGRSMYC